MFHFQFLNNHRTNGLKKSIRSSKASKQAKAKASSKEIMSKQFTVLAAKQISETSEMNVVNMHIIKHLIIGT